MSFLTASLLIDSLILLVNFPALVKNEKEPFVLVQTGRTRMDVRALGVGRGGAGQAAPPHWTEGPTRPRPALGDREVGGGRAGGEEGARGPRWEGASIPSLRVCACGSFCGRWGLCACRYKRPNACETPFCPRMCP